MSNWKIHSLYIIGFLILIIIALFTYKGGQQSDLVKHIAFAGTIVSILLALLAIIYAFLSNSSVAQTLSSLRDMSKEVTLTSNRISHLSHNLEEHLGKIPGFMESMESQVRETKEMILGQRERSSIVQQNVDIQQLDKDESIINIQDFITRCSLYGLLTLLGFYYSFNKKSGFNLNEFSKILTETGNYENQDNYIHGFLVSMNSAKLIEHTMLPDRTLTVLYLHSDFTVESIQEEINNRIKYYDKVEKFESIKKWLETTPVKIKDFFRILEKNTEPNSAD